MDRRDHLGVRPIGRSPLQEDARSQVAGVEKAHIPVDDHIASLDGAVDRDIAVLDGMLSTAFAGESRVLWVGRFWGGSDQAIIGYGDHRHERSNGETVEWFKVGLAAQKSYLSL